MDIQTIEALLSQLAKWNSIIQNIDTRDICYANLKRKTFHRLNFRIYTAFSSCIFIYCNTSASKNKDQIYPDYCHLFIKQWQHQRNLTPVTGSRLALHVAQRDLGWQGLWGMIHQTVPTSPAATVQIGDLMRYPSKWGSDRNAQTGLSSRVTKEMLSG